ncbi:MAG: hypothetical protein KC503_24180 [Myxococcales bacterium]|nr:hypothetical protein [Myxococcales bacterium]
MNRSRARSHRLLASLTLLLAACGARTPLSSDGSAADALAPPTDATAPSDLSADGPNTDAAAKPWSLSWLKLAGHLGDVSDIKVATHPAVGTVVAGTLRGTAPLGGAPLESHGRSDVVIARFDQAGQHIWSQVFGGERDDRATAVAIDAGGNIVVSGTFQGTARFGGAPLLSRGGQDVFVARYSAGGTHQWSTSLGGAGSDDSKGLALDGSGEVVVAGIFNGTIAIGARSFASKGSDDVFLARLSSSTGQLRWARAFGGAKRDYLLGVAAGSDGSVAITGYFEGDASFGGATFSVIGARSSDAFVARYDAAGAHLWSKALGGNNLDLGNAVAIDAQGGVVIAGTFASTASFGGSSHTSQGLVDTFVSRFDAAGQHLWSKSMGGKLDDEPSSIAFDGAGNITISGRFSSEASFGGPPLSAIGRSMFVARLSGSGEHIWSKAHSGTGTSEATVLAVSSGGDVTLGGRFRGEVGFGGALTRSRGAEDVFIARYSATGVHRWSRALGDTTTATVHAMAVDGAGNVVVAGSLSGVASLGGLEHASGAGEAVFVARYSPRGDYLWSRISQGTGAATVNALSIDAAGSISLAGHLKKGVSFGGATLTSSGSEDVFIARYSASGQHLWSQRFGGSGIARPQALVVDAAGNTTIGGYFVGPTSLGGATIGTANGPSLFIARYDSGGRHVWSKAYVGAGLSSVDAAAIDSRGRLVVVGRASGRISVGGAELQDVPGLLVAQYDARGAHLWSKSFETRVRAPKVAIGASDDIIVATDFSMGVTIGGATTASIGSSDVLVARFDASGAHLWSKTFGGKSTDTVASVALLGDEITVGGSFGGSISFGGAALVGNASAAFVARLRGTGAHVSSRAYGNDTTLSSASARALSVDASGAVVLSGDVSGVVDFGFGAASTERTIFIAKIAP